MSSETTRPGTKRVVLFGNSHLAALKYGLEGHELASRSGLELVFWGAPGAHFPRIELRGGALHSPNPAYAHQLSERRYRALPLAAFDAIVFYACHIDLAPRVRNISNVFAGARGFSSAFEAEATRGYLRDWFQSLTVWGLLRQIRALLPALPGLVVPHPMHSNSRLPVFKDPTRARRALQWTSEDFAADCASLGYRYLPQPTETLVDGLLTREELCAGSLKLNTDSEAHPVEDYGHMNADYGRLLLARMGGELDDLLR